MCIYIYIAVAARFCIIYLPKNHGEVKDRKVTFLFEPMIVFMKRFCGIQTYQTIRQYQ